MTEDVIICRCEEVSRKEIEEAIEAGAECLNEVKRISRASMGLCQGRTCRRLLTQIYCEKTGRKPEEVELTSYRPPLRPIPIEVLATGIESIELGKEYSMVEQKTKPDPI